MILIADSGSTKTTWMVVDSGNMCVTEGLNPHFSSDRQYHDACLAVCNALGKPDEVHFYGAGCGDVSQKARIIRLLQQYFLTDLIYVETDLLGACRAVSPDEASIVGILGTGSNACFFDGQRIKETAPSLGYILGDEGSANHLGRELVDNYLKEKMSEDLRTLFHEAYPFSYTEWMDHIYHQPNPNRFFASLARFAVNHIDLEECANDIWYVVDSWHSEQLGFVISRSHCVKINIVGSFGKAIEPLLRNTLEGYALQVGTIMADPIEGLRHYHLTHR